MTEFTQKDKLKKLAKDYEKNQYEIKNIMWNYLEENENELAEMIATGLLEHVIDIKDFKEGDKNADCSNT